MILDEVRARMLRKDGSAFLKQKPTKSLTKITLQLLRTNQKYHNAMNKKAKDAFKIIKDIDKVKGTILNTQSLTLNIDEELEKLKEKELSLLFGAIINHLLKNDVYQDVADQMRSAEIQWNAYNKMGWMLRFPFISDWEQKFQTYAEMVKLEVGQEIPLQSTSITFQKQFSIIYFYEDDLVELPEHLNPDSIFSGVHNELLSKLAKGGRGKRYDLMNIVKNELERRGMDIDGKWVGFDHKIER